MLQGGTGRLGTGRFDEAAIRAAQEAAKRAAAAAAKAAAEAAAREAAKAAAKRAAEAAAKANTGQLTHAKHADFGDLPWEKAVAGAVGAVTGSAAYSVLKNSLSVQKKVKDIQGAVSKVTEAKRAGENAWAKLSEKKVPSVKPLNNLGRINSAIRVTGGVQSALSLRDDLRNLTDGDVSFKDVTGAGKDVMNTIRGADEATKLVQGTTKGFLGKMAPGVSIVASGLDAANRVEKLSHWGDLSTKDKIANVSYLLGDAADIAGNFFPPAKLVGAGLTLVGMAAENWDSVAKVGSAVASGVSHAASATVNAVSDAASSAVHEVADTAKKATHAISSGIKHVFGGL